MLRIQRSANDATVLKVSGQIGVNDLTELQEIISRERHDGLVLDLREHDQAWVRNRFGDRHLGFSNAGLDTLLRGAGLTDIKVNVGASKAGDPFAVLIASGVKANAHPGTHTSRPTSKRYA